MTLTGKSGQILISTDGHAGADIQGYKPYLEKRFHEEFDAWAATYVDPWGEVIGPSTDYQHQGFRQGIGHASFDVPLNWESADRYALMQHLGISAEVLFPNTAPPFAPSGAVSVPPPLTQREYEYRWAGIKAHNRWMADFCKDAPGQRAGFAQLYLNDIGAAVEEVYWAKGAGLRGVLLPADHVKGLTNIFQPTLDPLWAACQETDLPVHKHQVQPGMSPQEGGVGSFWVGIVEIPFYASRGLVHLLASAVFAKFPNLKFVLTELSDAHRVVEILTLMDNMYEVGKSARPLEDGGSLAAPQLADAVHLMDRKPSEYFASNCYLAGPLDPISALASGVPNLMWGADIPHSEGTGKYTREAARVTVEGLDGDEVDDFLYKRAAQVYGFDVDYLQGIADGLEFTRAEARTPFPREEWPEYPRESHCGLFRAPAQLEQPGLMIGR